MKLTPIGERIVIKPVESKEERTKSGIYLPKSSEEKKEGEVVSVGMKKDGSAIPLRTGDRILYGGYSSEEFEIDGDKHLIIDFKDILAKIENNGGGME